MTAEYQLRKDGDVLETHSTLLACQVAALERKLAVKSHADWQHDFAGVMLINGVEIEQTEY